MLYHPRQDSQGFVENALILVLVAVVAIVILAYLGPAIGNTFSNIVESLLPKVLAVYTPFTGEYNIN